MYNLLLLAFKIVSELGYREGEKLKIKKLKKTGQDKRYNWSPGTANREQLIIRGHRWLPLEFIPGFLAFLFAASLILVPCFYWVPCA